MSISSVCKAIVSAPVDHVKWAFSPSDSFDFPQKLTARLVIIGTATAVAGLAMTILLSAFGLVTAPAIFWIISCGGIGMLVGAPLVEHVGISIKRLIDAY